MSTQREYLIIGDSNVRRFYHKLGLQSHNLTFVQARSFEEVGAAMSAIGPTYKFVVFAFITNLIVTAGEECADHVDRSNAIEELFTSLLQVVR